MVWYGENSMVSGAGALVVDPTNNLCMETDRVSVSNLFWKHYQHSARTI